MSFGGSSNKRQTAEYFKSLPTVGDASLLTDGPEHHYGKFGQEARVGQRIYRYSGPDGGWNFHRAIPDDVYKDVIGGGSPSSGESSGGHSGGGGGGGRSGGGLINPLPELGPYPNENIYRPILETEYIAPAAQDWSQYMPVDGLLTGGAQARYPQAIFTPLDDDGRVLPQTPSAPITDGQQFDIGGLLYQPWSTEYQQAFVPGNIWQYDPNQFGVGQVSYRSNPFGSLQLPEDWEDLLSFEEPEGEGKKSEGPER